jgi:uncharacterized protein involved in outer membrane biogenesis
MAQTSLRRWVLVGSVGLLVVIVGAAIGFRLAVGYLKGKVVEALGPGSEIADIQVGWSEVTVNGLRIKASQGWPAADALRTERVVIVPSLRGLLGGEVRVGSIRVVRPYVSALRTKDGKLHIVPTLLERPPTKGGAGGSSGAPPVHIGKITLEDGVVELFDATVAQPPLKIRLEQLQATVQNVLVPSLTGKTEFDVTGLLKGVRQDGRVKVGGWAEVATKDSSVKMELREVDLVALQPYLSRAAEARVHRGGLDLDLQSDVRRNRLQAPGKVTLANLEFAPSGGLTDTFMGVPRSAVLAYLRDKNNRITVDFTLEGDINNPQFSLNEAFATRLASSMAEGLGVSIRGVAEGIGTLGRKGADAIGEGSKGIGGAIQGLFGGTKKK